MGMNLGTNKMGKVYLDDFFFTLTCIPILEGKKGVQDGGAPEHGSLDLWTVIGTGFV